MEVQMAAQGARSAGRATPPHHHSGGGDGKHVPGYLRPPAGSCHHVCKYGGAHAFEDKETPPTAAKKKPGHTKPRKQPSPAAAALSHSHESQSGRVMGKVRSVFRRRVGDSTRAADKAAARNVKGSKGGGGESVEWKDIVAYDNDTTMATKKKDKNKSRDEATKIITGQVDGVQTQDETLDKKSAKPPQKMGIDQELLLHGYQILSPSLLQSRASLLRDLEQEMVHEEAASTKQGKPTPTYSLEEEEYIAAAAAETSRAIPAHRRVKSMSISSRSVRYPFIRQASKNSSAGTFKLRSRSTKVPMAPPPEEETTKKPARLRSRRGSEDASSGSATGRGIQLRIRSLRRRGVGGGSGGAGTGFVVPAVALRHLKTLERKKSQRLYNGVIEETASKLVKTRKSRVKALVGAFESVISKIAK
ncbi:unnamed protein product [Urochloa decumbens]|uniref:Calmodulin-binding domain-containing protein n=1 Tax=Urochloa decumbens TaxID=240449 RepID=A0ABC8VK14_9POAL